MTEMAAQVNVYSYDPADGSAELLQVCDTVSGTTDSLGAAIRLHPSGRWLYVSVRGADVLVRFRIGEDGCLTEQSRISSGGMIPRDFDLTPDGRFLLAANQDSDTLCVFEIDTEGTLHPRGCCDTPIGACTVLHIL